MTDSEEDKDMQTMAYEELDHALKEEQKLHNLLLKSLLPKDDADARGCILEVRAGNNRIIDSNTKSCSLRNKVGSYIICGFDFASGTGGEEASLFAMDIFKM